MGESWGEVKADLKMLIQALHAGADPEDVKKRFKEILADVSPLEIARVEQELIDEGLPAEEVRRLCDVHLAVFKESLDRGKVLAPPGHPVHILMEEHKIISQSAEKLKDLAEKIKKAGSFDSAAREMKELKDMVELLKDSESHHIREENVLFPYLEKHGITQPPAIMWMEHDEIREAKKRLYALLEDCGSMVFTSFAQQLQEAASSLAELLPNHIYKENNILYPTALKVISENEWKEARKQFDELGYCRFTPRSATGTAAIEATRLEAEVGGRISFDTGSLSQEELEAMLNTLPVDITFVDSDDTVRYFSQGRERIFPRAKAVIGRKVQQCHPQKSLHLVNRILEDFKSGSRDWAEFWINAKGRKVYIRYFAVRNAWGKYLGCVEVTQDITRIQKLEGEKRLLES